MNIDPHNLVPRDKFDMSNTDKLLKLSDAEIEPLLWDLLQWTQDMNWPVASEIVHVLSNRGNILEPYILKILSAKQDDAIWKYWILSNLLPRFTDQPSQEIILAIKRIAEHPTKDEISEEADAAAKIFLKLLK